MYAPGAGLLALWIWAFDTRQATGLLLHRLNQTGTGYDAVFYVLAAILFVRSYTLATTPIQRQQLKWLMRGAWLAVGPFTLFYAIPFLFDLTIPGLIPGRLSDLAALCLVFCR